MKRENVRDFESPVTGKDCMQRETATQGASDARCKSAVHQSGTIMPDLDSSARPRVPQKFVLH
jgi:hypothetical protein